MIRNQQDFVAGILFAIFGIFFASFGSRYQIGALNDMGPGFAPVALGLILAILGLVIAASGMSPRVEIAKIAKLNLRVVVLVLAPVVVFGLFMEKIGIVASVIMIVMFSSYASREVTWRGAVITSAVLVFICLGIFVWGLGLRLPIWPAFVA